MEIVQHKRFKDTSTYAVNPTQAQGIVDKIITVDNSNRGKPLVDPETGEIYNLVPMSERKQITVDERTYVKLYTESIYEFDDLTLAANKIILYAMRSLKPCTDIVKLIPKEVIECRGISSPTSYYKGLLELINKGFLFRKSNSDAEYFINVNYFYNGNRAGKVAKRNADKNK